MRHSARGLGTLAQPGSSSWSEPMSSVLSYPVPAYKCKQSAMLAQLARVLILHAVPAKRGLPSNVFQRCRDGLLDRSSQPQRTMMSPIFNPTGLQESEPIASAQEAFSLTPCLFEPLRLMASSSRSGRQRCSAYYAMLASNATLRRARKRPGIFCFFDSCFVLTTIGSGLRRTGALWAEWESGSHLAEPAPGCRNSDKTAAGATGHCNKNSRLGGSSMLKTRAMFLILSAGEAPRKTFAAQSSQVLGPGWQVTDGMSATPHF